MTNKLNGVTVTFDRDIREDDAQALLQAIGMIKGVVHVEPNIVATDDWMAQMQTKCDIRGKLLHFIKNEL